MLNPPHLPFTVIPPDDIQRAAPASADPLAALRHATATRHHELDSGLAIAGVAPVLADYAAPTAPARQAA